MANQVSKKSVGIKRQDLTEGSIPKKLTLFGLPLLAGNIVSQLYNVADSIVVGNVIGSDALAAVGSCFPLNMVIHGLLGGLAMGCSVLVGQYIGAKRYDEVSKTTNTTLILATLFGIFLTALGLLISGPVLRLLRTPENIFQDAVSYFRIVLIGLLGQMYYQLGSEILRGMGDSKYPMIMLTVCSVLNVVLDILFVGLMQMGVEGAAWATTIAQYISGALVLVRIYTMGTVEFNRKALRIDVSKIKPILRIGLPSGIQLMVSSAGMMVIQFIGNGFGSDFVATLTVVQKVDGFTLLPQSSLSQTASPFVAQNIGAHKDERLKKGIRLITLGSMVMGVALGLLLVVAGKPFIGLFTSNAAVIEMSYACVLIMACGFWASGLQQSLSGVLRGSGNTFVPMLIMIGAVLVRIPAAFLLATMRNDYRGVFGAMLIANLFGAACMLIYYLRVWKKRKV